MTTQLLQPGTSYWLGFGNFPYLSYYETDATDATGFCGFTGISGNVDGIIDVISVDATQVLFRLRDSTLRGGTVNGVYEAPRCP